MADDASIVLYCLRWFHSQKYRSFMRHREMNQAAAIWQHWALTSGIQLPGSPTTVSGSTLLTKMLGVCVMWTFQNFLFFEKDQGHRFCKDAEELDIRCPWSLKIQLLESGEWSGLSWPLTSNRGLGAFLGTCSGDWRTRSHRIHMARYFILPRVTRGAFHLTAHHFEV